MPRQVTEKNNNCFMQLPHFLSAVDYLSISEHIRVDDTFTSYLGEVALVEGLKSLG